MNEKVLFGPKFGTLINRKWITNIWVVTIRTKIRNAAPFLAWGGFWKVWSQSPRSLKLARIKEEKKPKRIDFEENPHMHMK
jgi:hypothetical protein